MVSSVSFAAYTPSEKDTQDLTSLKAQMDSLIKNNIDLWNFYNQVVNLQDDYSKEVKAEIEELKNITQNLVEEKKKNDEKIKKFIEDYRNRF